MNGWLQVWLILGGALSATAIQNTSVSTTSRELYCNANVGLLPFGKWVARLKSFKRNSQGGKVPWVSLLITCTVPVALMVFDFETLVVLDAFLIAFTMLLSLLFYIYAKHGRHGFYSRHKPTAEMFHVKGGIFVTLLLISFPITVVSVLVVDQGWIPFVIFVCFQVFMFSLTGIEALC